MRKVLYFIFLLSINNLFSQDISYLPVNPRNVVSGSDTFYLIDILAYSKTGIKLGAGQLYFNFDTTNFGANVVYEDKLEIIMPDSTVLSQKIGAPPFEFNFYGDFVLNDNTDSRFSFSWQHDFSKTCLTGNNIDFYSGLLLTIKIRYKTGHVEPNPTFCFESGNNFNHQSYTACGPNNCNTNDCLNFPGTLLHDYHPCENCRIVYATNNDGIGTLRAAMLCAASGDTIVFAPNLKNDTLSIIDTSIIINKDIRILGKDVMNVTIDASGAQRLFDIDVDKNVVIQALYILAGTNQDCSAILNNGNLILRNLKVGNVLGNSVNAQVKNLGVLKIEGEINLSNN